MGKSTVTKAFKRMWLLLFFVIVVMYSCLLTSCGDEEERDENIYFQDLVGTWNSDDDFFLKDCLYFRGDGNGQYEYGNNLPSGNRKVNFTWAYPNFESRYVIVNMEQFMTDLDGGRVYRYADGSLVLDYLGARYTKVSSDVPSFTCGGGSLDGGNITNDFLCKNGGVWKYENNYTYVLSGNTQYVKSIYEVDFSKNGTIIGHFYWERSGKSGYPQVWRTDKSEVFAIGSYQILGNTLKCVFTNVTCSGSSDIETRHWNPEETNYKNYKMEYEDDGTLILSLDEEIYRLTNDSQGSGSGGGSSSYEKPDISYYDAVPGATSIKVTYKIWNKSNCGSLSDAKVYYGESSASKSITAIVSGDYITATISGLSKGTQYRVKCSVTGLGGVTTTGETILSTLY